MVETLHLWRNARIAACDAAMTRFAPGALLTRGARIEWLGAERNLPADCGPRGEHDLRRTAANGKTAPA